MSVEELLKDRYKVIADYPQSPFAPNEIIEFTTNEQKIVWMLTISGLSFGEFEEYPHLFRKLEWWEDRKEDEMPEYVRYYEGFWFPKDTFIKVYKWELYQNHCWFYEEENAPAKYVLSVLPATEEDCINQNKKQNV